MSTSSNKRSREEGEDAILFVTCREVKGKYDTPEGRDGNDISKVLTNLLSEDARESYKGKRKETLDNLRVGTAWNVSKDKSAVESKEWNCKVFENQPIGSSSPEAKAVAAEIAKTAKKTDKPILLYVHGYNSTVTEPLQAAAQLGLKYNCIVIPFLWPTEGQVLDYDKDRKDAEISARPFLRFIAKATAYLNDAGYKKDITLLVHSMGNYVLQRAVEVDTSDSNNESIPDLREGKVALSLLENIILNAADVDSYNHVEWVRDLKPKGKVFVCINTGDDVLKLSDQFAGRLFLGGNIVENITLRGPDHPIRLGQTLDNIDPTSDRIYVSVNVTMKDRLDFFQFLQMEHSYFRDGQDDIAAFYKDVIQGTWKRRDYKSKKERGGYYSVTGWSKEGR